MTKPTDAFSHIDGQGSLVEIPSYQRLRRVSSDCQPVATTGHLAVCPDNGVAQALITDVWRNEITTIYDNYRIWHQSQGHEQSVFNAAQGVGEARSAKLLKNLHKYGYLGDSGHLLDIGCGNGSLLRSAQAVLPEWRLSATEYDDTHQSSIEAMQNVEAFYTCELTDIHQQYDVITLVHVLEHIENPRHLLADIGTRLTGAGQVVIEVPFHRDNPFDLIIADHATFYTPDTLAWTLAGAGYEVVSMATDWIYKEISCVARLNPTMTKQALTMARSGDSVLDITTSLVDGLLQYRDAIAQASQGQPFGVFGTAIGGTWLYNELPEQVAFFVDEDPNRVGQHHVNRPIYSPENAPKHIPLAVPLVSKVAPVVSNRMAALGFKPLLCQ